MPRINSRALNCSVYLYTSEHAAMNGHPSGGCGFLLSVPIDASEPLDPITLAFKRRAHRDFHYVVTCGHVAEKHPVVRLNKKDRQGIEALRPRQWFYHMNSDLAVAFVDLCVDAFEIAAVSFAGIIEGPFDPFDQDSLVGIGDDVFIVSRFVTHAGKLTNWPAVRFGNISVMPREDEPIARGKGKPPQVAYLVEVRTVPGVSGSPVFQCIPGWEQRDMKPGSSLRAQYEVEVMNWQTRNYDLVNTSIPPARALVSLLGVSGGYLFGPDEQVVYERNGRWQSNLRISRNSGMEWCVPSWKINELLNTPPLPELREAKRQEWAETPPSGADC